MGNTERLGWTPGGTQGVLSSGRRLAAGDSSTVDSRGRQDSPPAPHGTQNPQTSEQSCGWKTSVIWLQKSKNQAMGGDTSGPGWVQLSTAPHSPKAGTGTVAPCLCAPPRAAPAWHPCCPRWCPHHSVPITESPILRQSGTAAHQGPAGAGWGHPGAVGQGQAVGTGDVLGDSREQ